MTWQPQLVALDIDGTLVDHDGVMPEPVFQAVQRVLEAGVPVVLATGRSWDSTRPVFEALHLPPGPAVSSNGAVIVDFPPFQIRRMVTFDPTDVVRKVMEVHPAAALAVEVIGRGYRVTKPFPDGDLHGEVEQVSVAELAASPVTRIVVRDPNASDQEFIAMAERLGLHGVGYFIGWSAWLDIAPEGVDKAGALADICEAAGIPAADVLALGDGRNDMEMLTWAGRGVALGDAPAEVRAAADHVTDRFADGGTVNELDRWFP